ncbi:hypothetical protein AC578_2793 [Pseudocercospora eumusae]|uniref:Uncharacterized protein n=1 Tax=Pseudocercospora eumusae TaxID=321146 RepID=A0A139HGY0_9PEZI|nr:hypothetical protein AC578_2793 [Pseudocercospora eumusae]
MIRLLNIFTLEPREWLGDDVPPYVIASHRWLEGEARYQELADKDGSDTPGFRKVRAFCEFIRSLPDCSGFQWLWIDTVCIDKTNSVELSEAINSMFRWYQRAYLCIAYIWDVTTGQIPQDQDNIHHALQESDWFKRGWTLQELLAPDVVMFTDRDWRVIGHKGTHKPDRVPQKLLRGPPLNQHLSEITKIAEEVLWNYAASKDFSFRKKRTWLDNRFTTRDEDHAYCMLGIFGVSMSPIYGERRRRAWQRLEEEARRYELRQRHDDTQSEVSFVENAFKSGTDSIAHPHSRHDVLAETTRSSQPAKEQSHDTKILALQDQLLRAEAEKSALALELRAANKSARRALSDSEQLTSQLSELEFNHAEQRSRYHDLEQENTRAWTLVDTERWKRQAAEQAIQDQRLEYETNQQHVEDQSRRIKELEQELLEQLRVRKDMEESSAKAYAAVTQETAWRKRAEQQLARDRSGLSAPEAKITSLERGLVDKDAAIKTEQDARRKMEQELIDAMRALENTEKARKALEEDVVKLQPLPDRLKAPVRFKDAIGRKFSFPWHLCKSWNDMEKLIKKSFLSVEGPVRQYVNEGKYDLTGPDGEIVLPTVWDSIIRPDWSITMHLWPRHEEDKKTLT